MPSKVKGGHVYHAMQEPEMAEGSQWETQDVDDPDVTQTFILESQLFEEQEDEDSNSKHDEPEAVKTPERKDKCKYSVIISPFSASTSQAPPASKRNRLTGSTAFHGICEELSLFNDSFWYGLQQLQPTTEGSPICKTRVIERAQELETDLDDDELVDLLMIFEKDHAAADAYMVIKSDTLQKCWVEKKLERD
ncbi:uncharacterized protein LAESUDRAFT_763497 [Laetiporus sulphureus 93-53]|uniref:Uncharacterized protein n=1 Tax=Laetiporus sulphureus 93-53 TaxID=1314785 RepID=A0A165BW70_9APHY|nr:uncharacterized protein LAESUDRAFT_763497 [Laetiporus sulphureus 93-53]KZT01761.1 hypothetical protein LAESUDRAFT_763497 [Laetiporus sulphureus 93-53]